MYICILHMYTHILYLYQTVCIYQWWLLAAISYLRSRSPGSWQEVCWRTATSSVPTRALKHRWAIQRMSSRRAGHVEMSLDFPIFIAWVVIFPWVCMGGDFPMVSFYVCWPGRVVMVNHVIFHRNSGFIYQRVFWQIQTLMKISVFFLDKLLNDPSNLVGLVGPSGSEAGQPNSCVIPSWWRMGWPDWPLPDIKINTLGTMV